MAVTCKHCQLAPVICSFSANGLEQLYCRDCLREVVLANDRVHETEPPCPEPGDLDLLDATEARLQKLIDNGEWKA